LAREEEEEGREEGGALVANAKEWDEWAAIVRTRAAVANVDSLLKVTGIARGRTGMRRRTRRMRCSKGRGGRSALVGILGAAAAAERQVCCILPRLRSLRTPSLSRAASTKGSCLLSCGLYGGIVSV